MAAANPTTGPKPLSFTRQYHREYTIWVGMHQRCWNTHSREYPYYGGRGINICRRWSGKNGFRNFLADMGEQPFKRASVHRKNNDGDYTRKNVTWATPRIQARNMRTNRVLRYKGTRMILVEWVEDLGMKAGTLGARLAKGWPLEKAFETPVGPSHGGGRKGNRLPR
jgi:hypothetical protein